MNQILSTSMPMDNKKKKEKKVNANPVAIKSILKFFAIAMLIFGIFTIGTGAYAVFKNQSEQQEQNLEPSISKTIPILVSGIWKNWRSGQRI